MAKTVGFTFTIGARLQSSVASAFDTVSGRVGRLKRETSQLKTVSNLAEKLTASKTTVESLRAEAAAGQDVAEKLSDAERAYSRAQKNAAKYSITVGNAAEVHGRAVTQIDRTTAAMQRQEKAKRNRAKRDELKGEIFGTVASLAIVATPIKMAIDFESAMANAAKTIDGMRDSAGRLTPEYYKMEDAIKKMGRELPLTHEQIASLFAAGGQMGLSSVEELQEFTTLAAQMSVAFGMSTEAAANSIGGFRSSLGLSLDETRDALDLMNYYANTSSATEASIANIVSRIGSIGKISGVSHQSVTAMAATLASMKIPDEVAGTGLKNFMLAMTKGGAASKGAREALSKVGIDSKKLATSMQQDAEGTMMAVMRQILQLPAHMQSEVMMQIFGTESIGPIAPMLTQLDELEKNLAVAGDKTKWAGAMQKEFESRSKTTANALILLNNKMSELSISVGSVLLPNIIMGANAFGSFLEPVIAYSQANPLVVSGIFALVGGLVAIRVAALAGSFGLTALSNAATIGRAIIAPLVWLTHTLTTATFRQSVATKAASIWQGALNIAMKANPVGIVITAVAALAGWFIYLYNKAGSVGGALSAMWDGCVAGLKVLLTPLEWALSSIGKIVSWLGSDDAEETDKKVGEGLAKMEAKPDTATQSRTVATEVAPVVDAPKVVADPKVVSAPAAQKTSPAQMPAQVSADAELEAAMQEAETAALEASAGIPMPQGSPPSTASAMAADFGGMMPGAQSQTITLSPTFSFSFTMDGVPDRDFGKRVVDSVESEKSAIQRILSGLLNDELRAAYG